MDVTQHWCHICSRVVYPSIEVEIKCPYCHNGFVEEITSASGDSQEADIDRDFGSRFNGSGARFDPREEPEPDLTIESIVTRRRRSILQLLEGVRAAGLLNETDNNAGSDRDRGRDRDSGGLVIEPFNQTIILRDNLSLVDVLGDHFLGHGLDLVMQHLSEIDPNRYGSPPTRKDAIEAMPTVRVIENSQCSICLDEFEIGTQVKEIPCKHRFHGKCIFPWLEHHSSCPVCRFQLPADESKLDPGGNQNAGSATGGNRDGNGSNGEGEGSGRIRRRFSIPRFINGLFGNVTSSSANAFNRSSSRSNED